MKQFVKYLLVGLIALNACTESVPSKQANGTAYFPLHKGFYQIYLVEENIYTELNPVESFTYELKTEVIDSFPNGEGDITYVIHQSKRSTESDLWIFEVAWSARVNEQRAVVTEGNVSFIQISFPAFVNKEWNGNALNSLPDDFYMIESVGSPYQLETSLEFNDVLEINQHDEVDELVRDQRYEVYARNVGLIYKESIVLNYCDAGPCFGQQIIKDGVEYWQTLKEHGTN